MRRTLIVGGGMLLLFGWMLMRDPPRRAHAYLTGSCMGPIQYRVKVVNCNLTDLEARRLNFKVDATLDRVNQLMSTYLPDSELMRFNRTGTEAFTISPDFQEVLGFALQAHRDTGGAFDPTVGAIVDYWGFGPTKLKSATNQFTAAKSSMGAADIRLGSGFVGKTRPEIQLDLSAVAKGFAVDQVDRLLKHQGHTNTMIEVGGEIRVSGVTTNDSPWRLAIQHPDRSTNFWSMVDLSNMALATSGTYYQKGSDETGAETSHIIDPRTARPTKNGVVSVSVVAPTCMEADTLATGLLVMGVDEGLAFVGARPGVEALFIAQGAEGQLVEHRSPGW